MKKKILFLGGAKHQIAPLLYCKKKKYHIIVCDVVKNSPGKVYADKFYNTSISNKKKILEISKKEKIDAIISYASEVGSTTQAYVGNKMRLPSNPLKSVEILAHKNKFRAFLKKEGFVCPKYKVFADYLKCKSYVKKNMAFPVILKPVDASGSKGIRKVENLKTIKKDFAYAQKFSSLKKIICEQFIEREGCQIAGDGFVLNGRFVFSHLADQYFNLKPNPLIPIGESWPTTHNKRNIIVAKKTIQKIFDILKIKFGAFNLDLHFLKNKKFMVIEIGPRNGGDYIPELIKLSSGVDLIMCTVEASLGHKINLSNFKKKYLKFYSTFRINSKKNGILKKILISNKLKKNIITKNIFFNIGQKIKKFKLGKDSIGSLILNFKSQKVMKDRMNSMDENIKIILK